MSLIYEAESLKGRIESHYHFSKCLNGYERDTFNSKANDLNKCVNCHKELKSTEIQIINAYNEKNNLEKEKNNLKINAEKEIENTKKKIEYDIIIKEKENENTLNDQRNIYNNNQIKKKNELIQLDLDIENLKKEIKEIEEKKNNEFNLKKKEELYKLSNEYKIKLIKYENQKRLEKQEKENLIEIKKKKFEADKEIKLSELKQKANLVQKIISIYKNISLS